MDSKDDQIEKGNFWPIVGSILLFIFVITIWLSTWRYIEKNPCKGSINDIFSAVNTLFSGLAFAGLIVTIVLQRKELKLQRQELSDTKKELERSANAENRQAESLKMSAKLAALDTLYHYYEKEENGVILGGQKSSVTYYQKKIECIQKIERILEAKEEK